MSLARFASPLRSASSCIPVLQYAQSSSTRSSARICSDCLRRISQRQQLDIRVHLRSLATAAAERQTLESETPPRNATVPETSIAGGHPVDESPPIQRGKPHDPSTPTPANEISRSTSTSSAPLTTSSGAVGSLPSTKGRKSKLRPRKAAMTLTANAVTALRELLTQPDPKLIRVGVKNRGCSGLAYHLEYVDKPGTFDEAVDQDGVKVLIDSKALFSIIGSEMDWIEDKLSRRFVFKNPNITEQCGCGESFSIG